MYNYVPRNLPKMPTHYTRNEIGEYELNYAAPLAPNPLLARNYVSTAPVFNPEQALSDSKQKLDNNFNMKPMNRTLPGQMLNVMKHRDFQGIYTGKRRADEMMNDPSRAMPTIKYYYDTTGRRQLPKEINPNMKSKPTIIENNGNYNMMKHQLYRTHPSYTGLYGNYNDPTEETVEIYD